MIRCLEQCNSHRIQSHGRLKGADTTVADHQLTMCLHLADRRLVLVRLILVARSWEYWSFGLLIRLIQNDDCWLLLESNQRAVAIAWPVLASDWAIILPALRHSLSRRLNASSHHFISSILTTSSAILCIDLRLSLMIPSHSR